MSAKCKVILTVYLNCCQKFTVSHPYKIEGISRLFKRLKVCVMHYNLLKEEMTNLSLILQSLFMVFESFPVVQVEPFQ